VFDYLRGGLATDEWRERLNVGLRDFLYRAKVSQETVLAALADAGYGRQLRCEVAKLSSLAVVRDRRAVRLVAYHLNEAQDGRVRV